VIHTEKNIYLEVLSASAGSGKTFRLVQTYLKLLTSSTGTKFEQILAMTFTNKAAQEMKERILEALETLAFPEKGTEEEQQKAFRFIQTTSETTGKSAPELQEMAKKSLSNILHNYGEFKIQTIDKFSLQLIRSFSRDLDINDHFEVIMREDELLERVVDQMLGNIGKPGFEKLTHYTLNYAKTNIEDGSSWNFRKELLSFSKILTNEGNQSFVQQILNDEYSKEGFEAIRQRLKSLKDEMQHHQLALYAEFEKEALTADELPGKSTGIFSYWSRLKKLNGEFFAASKTNLELLYDGKGLKPEHRFPDQLRQSTIAYDERAKEIFEEQFYLKRQSASYYNLALLQYIANELEEMKQAENIILISDFNKMIAQLLEFEDANYVYERLGNRFNHFLLDEFQDTSRLQWLNIIPLLHNSIAQGNKNLIVGDPKQAIYRFRNGVVEQFVALPGIYNPEQQPERELVSQFFIKNGHKAPLDDNWRSHKNIVEFNNAFFQAGKNELGDLSLYYSDVKQNAKGKDGGYVRFDFVDKDDAEAEEHFILTAIRQCEADGFKRGDICLLARNGKHGNRWAKLLTQAPENYKVVSDDSLSIGADKTVQLFIHYCHIRRNSSNRTPQLQFASAFFALKKENPIESLKPYWVDGKVGALDFEAFLTAIFPDKASFWFSYENLYDLGQQFIRLINHTELSNPYLHHLMEMLHEYDMQFGPDIRGFLEFWDNQGSAQTVQIADSGDAIRIMTAHKSKGLEFPVVLLPDLNLEIKLRDKFFVESPFGGLIYTTLPKENVPPSILAIRNQELQKILLDEFNLLYVACTRPKVRLYGLITLPKDDKKEIHNNTVNNVLYKQFPAVHATLKDSKLDASCFEFGRPEREQESTEEKSTHEFRAVNISDTLWFPEISLNKNEKDEFLSPEMRFGRQLHDVLASCNSSEEIAAVINEKHSKGEIEAAFIPEIKQKTEEIFAHSIMQDLIKNATSILNEQDLICDVSTILRPDKLFITENKCKVLDYKTGKQENKHVRQVKQYMETLCSMGFAEVEGMLLYTDGMVWVEVE
jgi:ATP-dependent exoDNAse (exonuclease V) beta subunit